MKIFKKSLKLDDNDFEDIIKLKNIDNDIMRAFEFQLKKNNISFKDFQKIETTEKEKENSKYVKIYYEILFYFWN